MTYHPAVQKIVSLLNEHGVWYETFEHEPVTTSEEAARVRPGYSLRQGAKALIIKTDKRGGGSEFVMCVLPGDSRLDSKKVRQSLDIKNFRFATEEEVSLVTGGVKRGGVPPFGNLFAVKVYADPELFTEEKIIFNAGDRSYSIAMKSADYRLLVGPSVL